MKGSKAPQLFLIGGPNGAGKTTTAFSLMPELVECYEYVNADAIAASLSPFNADALAFKAGRLMLNRIKELAHMKKDFAFETTMASRSFAPLIQQWQKEGYEVNALYIWIPTVELAIERVKERVINGGHAIPFDTITRRYHRSMYNFMNLYSKLCHRWMVWDNAFEIPQCIAQKFYNSLEIEIYDLEYWEIFKKVSL